MTLSRLKPLVFATHPIAAADIGPQGKLEWLPLSSLVIDPAYQREILDTGKSNIRRMIEGFSWALFGVLVVGIRGSDQYAIIDGQHRATAALMHGSISLVPCVVLRGGQADEARAFSSINGNVTRIHALQSFRAKVIAGDPGAVNLVEMCRSAGVTIAPYPKTDLEPGETLALGTIRVSIGRNRMDATLDALRLLRATDPQRGLAAACILAAADVMAKNPEWRTKIATIATQLAGRGGIEAMRARAQARKASRGGTEWSNLSAVLSDTIRMSIAAPLAQRERMMAGR